MTTSVSNRTSTPVQANSVLPPDSRALVTLLHAAQQLSISKRTLERLIAGGVFPAPVKIGRASRIPCADISKYLEQLRRARGDKIGMS